MRGLVLLGEWCGFMTHDGELVACLLFALGYCCGVEFDYAVEEWDVLLVLIVAAIAID